jgi:hypothetical protein
MDNLSSDFVFSVGRNVYRLNFEPDRGSNKENRGEMFVSNTDVVKIVKERNSQIRGPVFGKVFF